MSILLILAYLLILASEICFSQRLHTDLCKKHQFSSICDGNLGFDRIHMPQINEDIFDRWLKTVDKIGFHRSIFPHYLTPTQKEINLKIVVNIMRYGISCDSTIFVAYHEKRHYVIDGHHRYAACRLLSTGKINAIIVNIAPVIMINTLNNFSGVDHYDVLAVG